MFVGADEAVGGAIQNNATAKTEEQTESDASTERVEVTLQEILHARMNERVTVTRQVEKEAKRGRWILKILPRR